MTNSNESRTSSMANSHFESACNPVQRRSLLMMPRGRLVALLLGSAFLHWVIVWFTPIALFAPIETEVRPLTARFVKLAPPPTIVAAPALPPTRPKPRRLKPTVSTTPAASSPDTPLVPEAVSAAAPVSSLQPDAVASAPTLAQAAPEQPLAPTVAEPTRKEVLSPSSTPPARLPPKRITLDYLTFLGEQKFEVGPAHLLFTRTDDNRYRLRLTGRGHGLAALLYPGVFTGESEGSITAEGLRPDYFVEERGNASKRREIRFDHVNRRVLIPDKEPSVYEGLVHDPLTWIVQFYFAAPKGQRITFTVATTRKLDVYILEKIGEAQLDSPIGPVRTEVWKGERRKNANGSDGGSAQFWLAPEWHYVPFKIKLVNAQGRSASLELTAVDQQ